MIKALLARYRTWRDDTIPASGPVPPLRSSTSIRADIASDPARGSPVAPSRALLITQCPDPLMWYAGKVGKHVPYCGTWPEGYKSREDAGYLNIVKFEDAMIVHLS